MTIRKATYNDLQAILDIQKKAFVYEAEIHNDFTIQPLMQTIKDLNEEFEKKNKSVFVSEENGKIVGSVRCEVTNNECLVQKLVVHPDFQNKGIGSALMNVLEDEFKYCSKFKLFTGKKSERNIRFYTKRGYQLTSFSGTFHDNVHLVFMEKMNFKN